MGCDANSEYIVFKVRDELEYEVNESGIVTILEKQDHKIQQIFRKLRFNIPKYKKMELDQYSSEVFLLIDGNRTVEEMLYPAMEDFVVDIKIGERQQHGPDQGHGGDLHGGLLQQHAFWPFQFQLQGLLHSPQEECFLYHRFQHKFSCYAFSFFWNLIHDISFLNLF